MDGAVCCMHVVLLKVNCALEFSDFQKKEFSCALTLRRYKYIHVHVEAKKGWFLPSIHDTVIARLRYASQCCTCIHLWQQCLTFFPSPHLLSPLPSSPPPLLPPPPPPPPTHTQGGDIPSLHGLHLLSHPCLLPGTALPLPIVRGRWRRRRGRGRGREGGGEIGETTVLSPHDILASGPHVAGRHGDHGNTPTPPLSLQCIITSVLLSPFTFFLSLFRCKYEFLKVVLLAISIFTCHEMYVCVYM